MQFDEPSLPAALAGRLSGVTSLTPVHPVDEATAVALLDECVSACGQAAVHSCAPDLPWDVLRRSVFGAVSVDASTLQRGDLDGIGEFVETGRTVLLGVIPSTTPAQRPTARETAQWWPR